MKRGPQNRAREKWIATHANRSDAERVHSVGVGLKIRRWIEAWEFVRKCKRWTFVSTLPLASIYTRSTLPNTIRRIRRRVIYYFHAAGLIELYPWPAHQGIRPMFRVRKRWATLSVFGSSLGSAEISKGPPPRQPGWAANAERSQTPSEKRKGEVSHAVEE